MFKLPAGVLNAIVGPVTMTFGKLTLRSFGCGALIVTLLGLSACATRPPASNPEAVAAYNRTNDPLEPMNRAIFDFNMVFDGLVMRPIAITYRTAFPKFFRTAMTNFLHNLEAPFILANDILQAQPRRGSVTMARFITNSTFGIGGLFDPATKWGLERHVSDLGQTLAIWGMKEGPYLVLPFIGPSNPRDGIGLAGEFYGDPTSLYIEHEYGKKWSYARTGMIILDFRTDQLDTLDQLEATSADFYAAMRSAYRQNRDYRIHYGKPPPPTGEEDIFAPETEEPAPQKPADEKPAD